MNSGRSQEMIVNGAKSETAPVLSGIPQGTVLGPVLFVIYINDILENLSSEGLLFADDTKIFRKVTSRQDALNLQFDIKALEDWSKMWLLCFNPDKCHVLSSGKLRISCIPNAITSAIKNWNMFSSKKTSE